jgi:hypothetical protein
MGEERNVYKILMGKNQKKRDHWEDQSIDGRMGWESILGRLGGGSVDWNQLVQDRDR